MPGTVTSSKTAGTRCAVFKIGLKGRFGFIDERTEELLGYSSDELFGKSIFEYVSDQSHELIERILSRRNRYECLYESVPLSIRCHDKHYRTFSAIITQNFVNGSPANFQIVMAPSSPNRPDDAEVWKADFLTLLARPRAEVAPSELAEIMRVAGGYTGAACWLVRHDHTLQSADHSSTDLPSILPPPYLLPFIEEKMSRYSFRAEDRAKDERFGADLSEALFFLSSADDCWILVLLRHEIGYQPTAGQVDHLQMIVNLWNREDERATRLTGNALSLLGEMYDLSGQGVAVITEDFTVVYKNATFVRELEGEDRRESDFSKVWTALRLHNHLGAPVSFDSSPIFDAAATHECRMARLGLPGSEHDFVVAAAPWQSSGTRLTMCIFIPLAIAEGRESQIAQSARVLIPTVVSGTQAPLNAMATIAANMGHIDKQQADHDFHIATESLQKQISLIQRMLDGLSAIADVWSADESLTKFNSAAAIREAVPSAASAAQVHVYDVVVDDSLPEILSSPKRILKLFNCLLLNAFTFSARAGRPIIRVEYSRDNRWHRFSVTDNGPGVEAEYTQKIFEPFFRTPAAMHRPGVGIGLTLAREIVLSLGGAIWCDAASDGCRIIFTLPVEERPRP